MTDISVNQYVRSGESSVDAAARAASVAVMQLARDPGVVRLDFASLRGAASNYFDVLFGQIVEEVGSQEFETRVELVFETPTQRLVATRSREAVLKAG